MNAHTCFKAEARWSIHPHRFDPVEKAEAA